MHSRRREYMRGRFRTFAVVTVGSILLLAGCKEDTLTDLGAPLRTAPDSLRSVDLVATVTDTVFPVPVSMGNSPTGQVGQQSPYTTHLLYAFKVPSFTIDVSDTFGLDTANLTIELADNLGDAPFSGVMRLTLRELQSDQRGWSTDSILTQLPDLTPATLADDVLLDAVGFDADDKLFFELDLGSFTDYDSVRALGDSLEINVTLMFNGFDSGAPGFLEYPHGTTTPSATFNGFSDDQPTGAILTANPLRQLMVVEYDSTYSPDTRFVVSDGHRTHTWVVFADVSTVLPENAFVTRADFVLIQADSTVGLSFGVGPSLGVMIPSDTTQVFSEEQNTLGLSFSTGLDAAPGEEVSINITAYMLDQQEGTVENVGMILRLSNEGTKARHFEFHGSRDSNPALRPRIRIIYGTPADFGNTP
jgi:hypothetical protein